MIAGDRHPSREVVHAWLDGDLDPGEERSLASHLETCEPCRSGHGPLLAAEALLASSPLPRGRRLPRVAAVALVLAVAVAGALLYSAWVRGEALPDLLPDGARRGPPALIVHRIEIVDVVRTSERTERTVFTKEGDGSESLRRETLSRRALPGALLASTTRRR